MTDYKSVPAYDVKAPWREFCVAKALGWTPRWHMTKVMIRKTEQEPWTDFWWNEELALWAMEEFEFAVVPNMYPPNTEEGKHDIFGKWKWVVHVYANLMKAPGFYPLIGSDTIADAVAKAVMVKYFPLGQIPLSHHDFLQVEGPMALVGVEREIHSPELVLDAMLDWAADAESSKQVWLSSLYGGAPYLVASSKATLLEELVDAFVAKKSTVQLIAKTPKKSEKQKKIDEYVDMKKAHGQFYTLLPKTMYNPKSIAEGDLIEINGYVYVVQKKSPLLGVWVGHAAQFIKQEYAKNPNLAFEATFKLKELEKVLYDLTFLPMDSLITISKKDDSQGE